MGVELRNDQLEVACFPEHGFAIGSITTQPLGDVLWNPPGASFGPLDGGLGPPGEPSVASFDREVLAGGWFLMFPSAGPPGPSYDGWMHGEAARLAWSMFSHDDRHVRARVETPDSGFLLDRRVTLREAGLHVETTARNDSGEVRSITFGEHPCFRRETFAGGVSTCSPETTSTHGQLLHTCTTLSTHVMHRYAAIRLSRGRWHRQLTVASVICRNCQPKPTAAMTTSD